MTDDERGGRSEHMSDVEALMWALDADPVLSSTFANITFLDRAPDPERFRRRLSRHFGVFRKCRGFF